MNAESGAISLKDKVQQSFTVGSDIISFDSSVSAARKSAAINSCLLAQLHASHLYPDRTKPDYADKRLPHI